MAYRDDILALSPDHLWRFEADGNDSAGTLNGTNSGMVFSGSACCEDAANSMVSNGTSDRMVVSTSADLDGGIDRKAVSGWFRVSDIQLPPKSIYREGSTGNQFNIVMWAGNNVMLDVVSGSTTVQAFSDQVFVSSRSYHIFARVEGTGFGDRVQLYIDGVEQSTTEPASGQLGLATLGSRTAAEWADPSGSSEVGAATVILNAPVDGDYNFWCSFSGAGAQLTDSEIRAELFEKGALPGQTITSASESAMQSQLDSLASSILPDEPLNIRVEALTGGGDLSLSADAITHNALSSIHIQYMGTDTLTWINDNGSNASIGSTPNGGAINFVTPALLTVQPLIAGTEVRIYESGTSNELAGIESSGTTFSSTISVSSVDIVIHALEYLNERVSNVDLTQGDVTVPIAQVFDRQYQNP